MIKKINLFLVVVFIIWWLSFILYGPKHNYKEIIPSTNEEIIGRCPKYYYQDSFFLNQLAEAFIETNHMGGTLGYNLHGRNPHHLGETVFKNPTYKLLRCQGWSEKDFLEGNDLTKIYPKIREIMIKEYPDANYCFYGINYANHVVFIRSSYMQNKNRHEIFFIYSNDIINIKKLFPEYKIYDKCIPQENDCWIYNFEKNWYICSPNYNFCITR